MKRFLYLLTTLSCLAGAATASAQDVSFEYETPPAKAEAGEAWQTDLVTEGLKSWQMLCKKGRLAEAEHLAQVLASLQPDNPKVRAACTVTQFFKALADGMTADMGCAQVQAAWQGPPAVPMQAPRPGEMLHAPRCVGPVGAWAGALTVDLQCASGPGACAAPKCEGGQLVPDAGLTLPAPRYLQHYPQYIPRTASPCCAQDNCCERQQSATNCAGAQAKSCCSAPVAAAKACQCAENSGCCCKPAANPVTCGIPCCPMAHMPVHAPMFDMAFPMLGQLPPRPGMMPPHIIVMNPEPAAPAPAAEQPRRVKKARPVATELVAHTGQQARLVTPHFEAECQRLTCADAPHRLVLEGNVRVTCKKNGQVFHIEGQRVSVDLKEGTFTVDGSASVGAWQRMQRSDLQPSVHIAPVPPSADR